MIGFQNQTTSAATATSDPHKHVQYNLGMVLGVDDFEQEFAYLSNRDQWLARDTIGYGTVCGLKVSVDTDAEKGRRVSVEPGVALSPRGQLMRVSPAQCAYLNQWLDGHRKEVLGQLGSPMTDYLTLHVVLCYRACPTDKVPIPGEPCRDETESTVNSRVQDDFKLDLRLGAPDQMEERAVIDFVEWLSRVEISEDATSLSLEGFLKAIREGAHLNSPPGSPVDYMYGSPPAGIVINQADACEYLRAAFRVWVTELRALWRGPAGDGSTPEEECVLLAELEIPLIDGKASDTEDVIIHEEHRPYVIHLRMLQEWLLCGPNVNGTRLAPASQVVTEKTFGQLESLGTLTHQYALADHTHGTPTLPAIPIPPPPGDSVEPEMQFGLASSPGTAVEYSRRDHTHGTPTLPNIPLPPQPADSVAPETQFGQLPNAGTSMAYSRADHTHGTPTSQGGPVTGDFVEHPGGLPPYAIVAAGIISAATIGQEPVYNDLQAVKVFDGILIVSFTNYTFPLPPDVRYIVKALPFPNPANAESVIVNFMDFQPEGFRLQVTNFANTPIAQGDLEKLQIMIEVSRFGKSVQPLLPTRINLNTASANELTSLPGITPALANRITALREQTPGGFQSLDDLRKVSGIGQKILKNIESLVTLSPK